MKHLVSLSLKYLSRQKLRSLLTFLCITLSVFLVGTCAAYYGSTLRTLRNQVISEDGSWEVDISSLLRELEKDETTEQINEKVDIISNHINTEESFFTRSNSISGSNSDTELGTFIRFDIDLDGKKTSVSDLDVFESTGDPDITKTVYSSNDTLTYFSKDLKDVAILPQWVHSEFGYNVGDTITLTITPNLDIYYRESKLFSDAIAEAEKLTTDRVYHQIYGVNSGQEVEGYHKYNCHTLESLVDISKYEPDERISGEPIAVSLKISGFRNIDRVDINNPLYRSLDIYTSFGCPIDLDVLIERNPDIPLRSYNSIGGTLIVNRNMDFDDGLIGILEAVGLSEDDFYSLLADEHTMNSTLLTLEFRSAMGIASLIPFMVIGFVIALIVWAIARFVIDNAFEMSVQERSVQFATLRVMGASKAQIITLIFTEAFFYIITSVPIGIAASFLLCKKVMGMLHNSGLKTFEFHANIAIAFIGTLLCIIGILISAYTSAIWAARKLSPTEAMNFGKPRKKERRFRKSEKKPYMSSKKFMTKYTMRNITSKKSRFIISSIALGMGVLLFNIFIMLSLCAKPILGELDKVESYDFRAYLSSTEHVENAEKAFSDKDLFSRCEFEYSIINMDHQEETKELLEKLDIKSVEPDYPSSLVSINRRLYDKYYLSITNIPYDDFVASGKCIVLDSAQLNSKGELIEDEALFREEKYVPLEGQYIYQANDETGFEVMGVLTTLKAGYNKFIIPEEIIRENPDLIDYYSWGSCILKLTLNDANSYDKCREIFNKFIKDNMLNDDELINDNFIENTGRKSFINAVKIIALAVILTIWLIGIFSMTNTVNTSVLNRQRELSMMRAVGMTKKQLYGTVILESILFSASACIIGTVLGTGVMAVFLKSVFASLPIEVSFITDAVFTITISIVINLAIAVLASLPGISSLSKKFK